MAALSPEWKEWAGWSPEAEEVGDGVEDKGDDAELEGD